MRSGERKIRWQEKQAGSAEDCDRDQDAKNAGKDGQQHQFRIRLQNRKACRNKLPRLRDPSHQPLLAQLAHFGMHTERFTFSLRTRIAATVSDNNVAHMTKTPYKVLETSLDVLAEHSTNL